MSLLCCVVFVLEFIMVKVAVKYMMVYWGPKTIDGGNFKPKEENALLLLPSSNNSMAMLLLLLTLLCYFRFHSTFQLHYTIYNTSDL